MRKYKIDELEIFSHFEPKQNWFQRNEANFAKVAVGFAITMAIIVLITNLILFGTL
jgi:hypothetical protein